MGFRIQCSVDKEVLQAGVQPGCGIWEGQQGFQRAKKS